MKKDKNTGWQVGGKYFIRLVTHYLTGELVAVNKRELSLKNAAWVASTGAYRTAVSTGDFKEVEMYPADKIVIVGRGALIDAVQIDKLPTEST